MKRIAVIGAGPVGLEAALYARTLGHEVAVYERETAGEHLRRWGHVTLFTPWRMNTSLLGSAELSRRGWSPPDPEGFPTGRELRQRYLLPLAEVLQGALQAGCEVLGVTRAGLLKADLTGGERRAGHPFRLLLRERSGRERWAEADFVVDASGVYGQPNPLGHGGLPAPGERGLAEAIDRGLPDVLGPDRARYAGRTVLLAGGGHSAATNLLALARLAREEPRTRITWIYRRDSAAPIEEHPGDPLPGRAALAREANRLAARPPDGLRVLRGRTVESLARRDGAFAVELLGPSGSERVECERIISSCGFRPDPTLSRELQAHFCYATEGSMRLAARILGSGSDCLKVPRPGADAQRHPEPGFFVLGHKGYGRNSAFLLAAGRDGVRDAFQLIEGKPDLDLYGGAS